MAGNPALSLVRRNHPLANAAEQRRRLETSAAPAFAATLAAAGVGPLATTGVEILQVNVGKVCNQTCRHCHVDAGPDRRESMTRETMAECMAAVDRGRIGIVDITGGAPEMNPHFRWLVTQARSRGCRVIDRCNLTILLAPGFNDLPAFLANHRVEIVASLPCYLPQNTDRQRGEGVYDRSISALKRLNEVGYGMLGTGLSLTLVFNPVGPSLPPPQATLEAAYRERLRADHGIEFTRLITIANMPISRFLEDLQESGREEEYLRKLVAAFNPATADGLMCRNTLSVGWDGRLYDCDFNQMLEMPVAEGAPPHIRDFDPKRLAGRPIDTGRHCFGCTAGSGSSCQGAVV